MFLIPVFSAHLCMIDDIARVVTIGIKKEHSGSQSLEYAESDLYGVQPSLYVHAHVLAMVSIIWLSHSSDDLPVACVECVPCDGQHVWYGWSALAVVLMSLMKALKRKSSVQNASVLSTKYAAPLNTVCC